MLLLAASTWGGAGGCSKKHEEEATAEKAAPAKHKKGSPSDRYADRKRLGAALKQWSQRWSRVGELPPCEPLLKAPSELQLCKDTVVALSTLKAAVAKREPEAAIIHDAAELAYAAEAALEKLNEANEKLQRKQPAPPAVSGRNTLANAARPPVAAPGAASASSKVLAVGSAAPGTLAEAPPVDPTTQACDSYTRLERTARRYLSQFLQFGPLATRQATFKELEGLSQRKERWWGLAHSVHEATLTETDRSLKQNLKALAAKLKQPPPNASALPSASAKIPVPVAAAHSAPSVQADKK